MFTSKTVKSNCNCSSQNSLETSINFVKAKLAEALKLISGYLLGFKQTSMMAGVNRDKRLPPATISVSHTDLKEKSQLGFLLIHIAIPLKR